jgi:hypothetical protein
MKPRRTPSSNKVYRLEGGTEDNDLWVRIDRHADTGHVVVCSTWELSDEERAAIAAGENVELIIWGLGVPPVALRTTAEPLGKGP